MFEDSLFATNARRPPQRGVAALLSFGIQAALLTVVVLVPMYYTDALPLGALKSYVEIPLPPGGPAPRPPAEPPRPRAHNNDSNMVDGHMIEPRQIPPNVAHTVDNPNDEPAPIGPYVTGLPLGRSGNGSNPFTQLLASNMRPEPPKPTPSAPRIVRVSRIDEGLLIHKVTPVYPKIAIITRTQGAVVLHAIIGRDGTIQNLQVISGHPSLIPAAVDAVKQWRYRPYLLNSEPVEVDTQIVVDFKLGG